MTGLQITLVGIMCFTVGMYFGLSIMALANANQRKYGCEDDRA